MKVTIWRCTEQCGNHYASSSMKGSLDKQQNHKTSMNHSVGETAFQPTTTRDTCPNCQQPRLPWEVEIPGTDNVTMRDGTPVAA